MELNPKSIACYTEIYSNLRNILYDKARSLFPDFDAFNDNDKLSVVLNNSQLCKLSAKTGFLILQCRRGLVYN